MKKFITTYKDKKDSDKIPIIESLAEIIFLPQTTLTEFEWNAIEKIADEISGSIYSKVVKDKEVLTETAQKNLFKTLIKEMTGEEKTYQESEDLYLTTNKITDPETTLKYDVSFKSFLVQYSTQTVVLELEAIVPRMLYTTLSQEEMNTVKEINDYRLDNIWTKLLYEQIKIVDPFETFVLD